MNDYFKIAEDMLKSGKVKRLLLHSCCAPCSSSVLEYLVPKTDVTVYYYNPNIMFKEEYEHRLSEQKRLCKLLNVPLIVGEYDNEEFLSNVKGLEGEREGGARCPVCFDMRLRSTAIAAKEGGFDYFCTTLTVSPHKNAAIINEVGNKISDQVGVGFLPSDFKKRNGFLRSIELSKKYGLYRQDYCGCRF